MSDEPKNPSTGAGGSGRAAGSAKATGGRPTAEPSHGPDGERRRGRRERERARDRSRARSYSPRHRSFFQRHRGEILGLIAVVAVVFAGGLIFVQANSKAYACTAETIPAAPASPLPNGSPAPLGQVQPDMGRGHILPPESQRYANCPPASGIHYAPPGGPIIARYYGPDDATLPQGWVHNLEHGGLVILYSCDQGACDDATQQALQALFRDFPDSPQCGFPKGNIGPVITRFEDMKAPIAALLWGRVLFQDKLDTAQILEFFKTQAELKNPEQQCARPSPTPAPGSSTTPSEAPSSASPAGSPSVVPSAVPSAPSSAAPSGPGASPAASPSPS
ncbi:MAG TPA: DUF3105 domain-containing protein [Patescibacteria group bacterium]|nr:DUF3105 domain-containing protein [Patescibacteria group bacterium]